MRKSTVSSQQSTGQASGVRGQASDGKLDKWLTHLWPAGLLAIAMFSGFVSYDRRITRVEDGMQQKSEQTREMKEWMLRMEKKIDDIKDELHNPPSPSGEGRGEVKQH